MGVSTSVAAGLLCYGSDVRHFEHVVEAVGRNSQRTQ